MEYLVKWLGYGHEHNSWELAKAVANAQQLVQAFENGTLFVMSQQTAAECDETKWQH